MTEYYKKPEGDTGKYCKKAVFILEIRRHCQRGWHGTFLGRRQDMISMKNGNKLYYQEMDVKSCLRLRLSREPAYCIQMTGL